MRRMTVRLLTAANLKAVTLFLLSAGLAAGVVLSNLYFQDSLQTAGTYGSSFIRRYPAACTDRLGLFFYLLRVRLLVVLLLLAVGSRAWGAVVALAYCAWLGYSGGSLMAAAVMQGGVTELLYTLAMLLPQAFAYIPAWCLLYRAIIRRSDRLTSDTMGQRSYRRYAAAVIILFLIGILAETLINPMLLKKLSSVL